MIIVEKKSKRCQIIDFVVPYDTRVGEKEKEKMLMYLDMARELKKLWNRNVKIIPVIVGALRTTPKGLPNRLKEVGITSRKVESQKAVLFHTARILRKILEIWRNLLLLKLKKTIPLIKGRKQYMKSVCNNYELIKIIMIIMIEIKIIIAIIQALMIC